MVKEAANPWYEVTLVEGRNRQIRRMFEKVGHHVEKIKRVRYGPLTLDVPPGKFRPLTLHEVEPAEISLHYRDGERQAFHGMMAEHDESFF